MYMYLHIILSDSTMFGHRPASYYDGTDKYSNNIVGDVPAPAIAITPVAAVTRVHGGVFVQADNVLQQCSHQLTMMARYKLFIYTGAAPRGARAVGPGSARDRLVTTIFYNLHVFAETWSYEKLSAQQFTALL